MSQQHQQPSLVDAFAALCVEHRVRKPNSTLVSLLRAADHEAAAAASITAHNEQQGQQHDGSAVAAPDDTPQDVTPTETPSVQTLDATNGGAVTPQAECCESQQPPTQQLTPEPSPTLIQAPAPAAAAASSRLTSIDLTGSYLGNAQWVALFRLIKSHPLLSHLQFLSLRAARLYHNAFDSDRPTIIHGNDAVRILCQMLYRHPSLQVIDLSENDIATQGYVWLLELCKSACSVSELILDGTLLTDGEKMQLRCELNRRARARNSQSISAAAATGGQSSNGGGGGDTAAVASLLNPWLDRRYAAAGGSKFGSSPQRQRGAMGAAGVDHHHSSQFDALLGTEPYFVFNSAKDNITREQLKALLHSSALFRCLRPFLSLSPNLQAARLAATKEKKYTEREKDRAEDARVAKRDQFLAELLEFLADVAVETRYGNGEIVLEAGDPPQNVFLVGSATGYLSSSTSHGAHEEVQFLCGSIVGEDELLHAVIHGDPPPVRKDTFVAMTFEKNEKLLVWQIRKEVFFAHFGKQLAARRAEKKMFVDSLPFMWSAIPMMKARLCDAITECRYADDEIILGRRNDEGEEIMKTLLIVIDGVVTIKRQRGSGSSSSGSCIRLTRGDIFIPPLEAAGGGAQLLSIRAGSMEGDVDACRVCALPLAELEALVPVQLFHKLLLVGRSKGATI